MHPQQRDIDEWLAQALRLALARRDAPAVWPLPGLPADLDRAQFVSRLHFHGIAPTLAASMPELPPSCSWIGEEIARETAMQRIWEESHRAVLVPLLQDLAAARVDALLMKGTVLAYLFYDDPAMRLRGDSDIIVPRRQLAAARSALAAAGFACQAPHTAERHQETWSIDSGFGIVHEIDLHWQISPAPALQRVLVAEEFTAESLDIPALSPVAKGVGRVVTMIHCAVNQAMHAYSGYYVQGHYVPGEGRLGWAQDIHLLASRFSDEEWDRLMRLAAQRHIAPTVLRALRSARDRLGTVVPDRVIHGLAQQTHPDAITDYLEDASPLRRLAMDLRGGSGLRDKLSALHWHLFPSRFRMRVQHPEYPDWPMPLLYLRRLISALANPFARRSHRG